MKKTILGLDLGTTSIGWALVNENKDSVTDNKIIKLGVRVNPLSVDEQTDFAKGNPLSLNADRTLKRGARRNLQRYKLRRENLIDALKSNGILDSEEALIENGKNTTHETLMLRARAAKEKIEKNEFARVLLAINKKRGYKSSRKAKNEEEGTLIDGMQVAKELYEENLTPGQFVFNLLLDGKKYIPDFYRSDLKNEFDKVWETQKVFYPSILNEEFYLKLEGQGLQSSRARFLAIHKIYTAENKGKRDEVKLQHYKWRSECLAGQQPIEIVAYVLCEINNNLNKSSGYLGAISDRSKELSFNKQTVGAYLYGQVQNNFHTSLKNQVFYRQDYMDEFETIWEAQSKHHIELTPKLKSEIRDIIIFYQRRLKSQKHLVAKCEFEKHHSVIPKSSPLFQEFKIWQVLNNLEFRHRIEKAVTTPDEELKQAIFDELNLRGNLKEKDIIKLAGLSYKDYETNYKESLEGNRTNAALFNVYQKIAEYEGYGFDWSAKTAKEILEELKNIFPAIGIDKDILTFNAQLDRDELEKQKSYQLWHLLYASEDDANVAETDKEIYGTTNVALKKNLHNKFGFKPEYGAMLANVVLQADYGSLCSRAIRKIIPYLIAGHQYNEACAMAHYNHSNTLTKEELEKRPLKDKLDILKKNSLRNPVVEKILNQMINIVNQITNTYGKPDEVRIELARELKQSADERARATQGIAKHTANNANIRKILQAAPFNIKNPSRNDIIRWKLYDELKNNGYKTLYTNQYIPKEKLFSNDIEIEHIIPKSRLFDDSFSNKTLATHKENQEKDNLTAIDYITNKVKSELENYKARLVTLYKNGDIGKAKYQKLLMSEIDIPTDFIDRDLRNSQYIAKKAKELLEEVFRTVNTTTGSITARLRNDWDLINVMQELNMPKYKSLGLVEHVEKKDGSYKERIKDWTKRNDHRHHAMDALTVAFTKPSHIQYLNSLNTRTDKTGTIYGIEQNETYLDSKNKRLFKPPMEHFREEAKKHIEGILISFKTKNKVATKNKNSIKVSGKVIEVPQITPRGQLHKETVYGSKLNELIKEEKVSAKFDQEKINSVTNPTYRAALSKRLAENNMDAKKAFTGKNALAKNPIYINGDEKNTMPDVVKTKTFEKQYTIRKAITPDLKIEKVIDQGIKNILELRLAQHNNDPKKAFTDLDKYPIWLNEEKGISIKRVKITGVSNAEALHNKKDHYGKPILDAEGNEQASDFVSTGNNHHVAIYKDADGNLQEYVVSFFEAVARISNKQPLIDKTYHKELGWEFLFTMKQNEMFLFPTDEFNPTEIDLYDENIAALISPHLFRVQKIATRNYFFRHHLETTVEEKKELKDIAYINIRSTSPLQGLIKVRINHLGKIVWVGEY